jgi:dolichol-phosphate mannosyltransferase
VPHSEYRIGGNEVTAMSEPPVPTSVGEAGPLLVVVLPVYNEVDSIAAVLAEIHEASVRLALSQVRTRVVIVDDESPDNTGAEAERFATQVGLPLTVITGVKNGLGDAMLRGLAQALEAEPDAIVTLDGDGQHNPADIPTLLRAFMSRRSDIAIGSRWTRGGSAPGTSPGRALGSIVGNLAFRMVTGTRGVKDSTTSFRVYSPRVVRFLLATDSRRYGGYSFFSTTIGLAEAAGFSITEVPIEFRPRFSGQSKLNRKEVWRYFASLWQLREERRSYVGDADSLGYRATDEIEQLTDATNWNRFIATVSLKGVIGVDVGRIVEVGAGQGGVTSTLLDRYPQASIVAIEPDSLNFETLGERHSLNDRVTSLHGTLADHQGALGSAPADLVVYVNVLEHIDDDTSELKAAASVLRPGGYLAIFVPALSRLYGPIDAKSGHFRRYGKASLAETVRAAGFDVIDVAYTERLGVVPYWLNYRVLNKAGFSSSSMRVFDQAYVPLMAATERLVGRVPFGKNVVCLARLPDT